MDTIFRSCGTNTLAPITMLAAGKVNNVIKSMIGDGVDGVCLMTTEGSLLCSQARSKPIACCRRR